LAAVRTAFAGLRRRSFGGLGALFRRPRQPLAALSLALRAEAIGIRLGGLTRLRLRFRLCGFRLGRRGVDAPPLAIELLDRLLLLAGLAVFVILAAGAG